MRRLISLAVAGVFLFTQVCLADDIPQRHSPPAHPENRLVDTGFVSDYKAFFEKTGELLEEFAGYFERYEQNISTEPVIIGKYNPYAIQFMLFAVHMHHFLGARYACKWAASVGAATDENTLRYCRSIGISWTPSRYYWMMKLYMTREDNINAYRGKALIVRVIPPYQLFECSDHDCLGEVGDPFLDLTEITPVNADLTTPIVSNNVESGKRADYNAMASCKAWAARDGWSGSYCIPYAYKGVDLVTSMAIMARAAAKEGAVGGILLVEAGKFKKKKKKKGGLKKKVCVYVYYKPRLIYYLMSISPDGSVLGDLCLGGYCFTKVTSGPLVEGFNFDGGGKIKVYKKCKSGWNPIAIAVISLAMSFGVSQLAGIPFLKGFIPGQSLKIVEEFISSGEFWKAIAQVAISGFNAQAGSALLATLNGNYVTLNPLSGFVPYGKQLSLANMKNLKDLNVKGKAKKILKKAMKKVILPRVLKPVVGKELAGAGWTFRRFRPDLYMAEPGMEPGDLIRIDAKSYRARRTPEDVRFGEELREKLRNR